MYVFTERVIRKTPLYIVSAIFEKKNTSLGIDPNHTWNFNVSEE